jgi:hypothetical protein
MTDCLLVIADGYNNHTGREEEGFGRALRHRWLDVLDTAGYTRLLDGRTGQNLYKLLLILRNFLQRSQQNSYFLEIILSHTIFATYNI